MVLTAVVLTAVVLTAVVLNKKHAAVVLPAVVLIAVVLTAVVLTKKPAAVVLTASPGFFIFYFWVFLKESHLHILVGSKLQVFGKFGPRRTFFLSFLFFLYLKGKSHIKRKIHIYLFPK